MAGREDPVVVGRPGPRRAAPCRHPRRQVRNLKLTRHQARRF